MRRTQADRITGNTFFTNVCYIEIYKLKGERNIMEYKDIEEVVKDTAETIADAVEESTDKVAEAVEQHIEVAQDVVSNTVEKAADSLEDFVEEIPVEEPEEPNFVDSVVDDVTETFEEGASKTKEFVNAAYGKAKDYSGIAYEKGKAFVGNVAEKSKGYASTAATFIGEAVRDLRDTTKMSVARTNEKSALKRSYEDLGKLYYEVMADKAEGEFLVCCNNIKASLDKIADLTAQIEAIRAKSNVQVVDATDTVEEIDEIQAVVEGTQKDSEE